MVIASSVRIWCSNEVSGTKSSMIEHGRPSNNFVMYHKRIPTLECLHMGAEYRSKQGWSHAGRGIGNGGLQGHGSEGKEAQEVRLIWGCRGSLW